MNADLSPNAKAILLLTAPLFSGPAQAASEATDRQR